MPLRTAADAVKLLEAVANEVRADREGRRPGEGPDHHLLDCGLSEERRTERSCEAACGVEGTDRGQEMTVKSELAKLKKQVAADANSPAGYAVRRARSSCAA